MQHPTIGDVITAPLTYKKRARGTGLAWDGWDSGLYTESEVRAHLSKTSLECGCPNWIVGKIYVGKRVSYTEYICGFSWTKSCPSKRKVVKDGDLFRCQHTLEHSHGAEEDKAIEVQDVLEVPHAVDRGCSIEPSDAGLVDCVGGDSITDVNIADAVDPGSPKNRSREIIYDRLLEEMEKFNLTTHYRNDPAFDLIWQWQVGCTTGVLGQAPNGQGVSSFAEPHNLNESTHKGKGVCLTPISKRSNLTNTKRRIWELGKELMTEVEPEFVYGRTGEVEQFVISASCMKNGSYVDEHLDDLDVRSQFALTVGEFSGGELECLTEGVWVSYNNNRKILEFDGRLAHRVNMGNFSGCRYSLIFYKAYDSRYAKAADVLQVPVFR